jgi:dihydrofolate reductase
MSCRRLIVPMSAPVDGYAVPDRAIDKPNVRRGQAKHRHRLTHGTAMAGAKRAAGDRDVLVHGAGVVQLALAAGVLDEMELRVVPMLLGRGRRPFEGLGSAHVELERVRTLEAEHGITHLRYRLRRS